MHNRFNIHMQEKFPEIGNKKLLLAISGGIDSIVLLELLSKLNLDLSLAHCNFQLRGKESEADEVFVRSKAEEYKTTLHVIRFDTKSYAAKQKDSIQMAARNLRYKWFKDLMKENKYNYLLTAHHADDNLETFFINLSRGTGIDGLCGIPEKSNEILRPLLPFSKEDICAFAMEQKLNWREDLSNKDSKYLRNKIRKELVPVLKELSPSFMEAFSSTISHLKGTKDIVEQKMDLVREQVIEQENQDALIIRFKVKSLLEYSDNTAYLYQLFYPFGFQQYEDIKSLLTAQSGKQIFSKTHRLLKHREYLLLSKIKQNEPGGISVEIQDADCLVTFDKFAMALKTVTSEPTENTGNFDYGPATGCFDKDLLTYPLFVRKWEKGDYFYPMGMVGKKKLAKFFKDEKYSLLQKENIWLLCSGEDIIWIIGKRLDDRFKISDKTKTILKATLKT